MTSNMEENAPFVSYKLSGSSSFNPDSFLEGSRKSILEPLALGSRTDESTEYVYVNKINSFGFVCGTLKSYIDVSMRRFIDLHLKDKANQILVVHANNCGILGPCSLLDGLCTDPKVLLSPLNGANDSLQYRSRSKYIAPLSFDERTITLKHVLALFTPPPRISNRGRILNTVQYVVSQLGKTFDLQKFIQAMDQEQWDEEGATFVALRQTLLTKLLTPPVGTPDFSFQASQSIILDLSDPVLSSTNLDGILVDIFVHAFLSTSEGGRKMIVFSSAEEYLTTENPLTRTLYSLGCLGIDRPATILISANDYSESLRKLLGVSDYLLTGRVNDSSWKTMVEQSFLGVYSSFKSIEQGKINIFSPSSVCALTGSTSESIYKPWGAEPILMDVDKLKPSIQSAVVPSSNKLVDSFSGSLKPVASGTLTNAMNAWPNRFFSTPPPTSGGILPQYESPQARSTNIVTPIAPTHHRSSSLPHNQVSSLAHYANPVFQIPAVTFQAYVPTMHIGPTPTFPSNEERVRAATNFIKSTMTTMEPHKYDLYLPITAFNKTSVTANLYPPDLFPVVSTILALSGGYTNVRISVAEVRNLAKSSGAIKNKFMKKARNAWSRSALRFDYSDKPLIFLVNPISNLMNQTQLIHADDNDSSSDEEGDGTNSPENIISAPPSAHRDIARILFPLAIVVDILTEGMSHPAASYKTINVLVGPNVLASKLGFPRFTDYVKEACARGIVTKQGKGPTRTLNLPSNLRGCWRALLLANTR